MKCEIILDLLPSYIDGLTSEVSNQEIEAHLAECTECKRYLEEMKSNVDSAKVELEDNEFMKILDKIRKITIEKTILVAAICACILAVLLYWGHDYMFGLSTVVSEEIHITSHSDGNKRELLFEPIEEKWHIIVGYAGPVENDEIAKDALFVISPLKARAWEGYQHKETNVFEMEFVDEDTVALQVGYETEYLDFAEDDYLGIDLSGKIIQIKMKDLYDDNLKGFLE